MKIHSLGNHQAGALSPAGTTAKSMASAKPAAASAASAGAETAPPLQTGERLRLRIENFEDRISRRFEALLGRADLTDEQRAGIEAAQQKLHGMLRRLDNALDDGSAEGAMQNILAHLRDTVSNVFEPQPQAGTAGGRARSGGANAGSLPIDAQPLGGGAQQIDTLA